MASYINPKCAIPLFLMTNETDAIDCGKIDGNIIFIILSIIIIIIGIYIYQMYKPINQPNKDNRFFKYVVVTIIIILILWLVFPSLFQWMNKMKWKGYNAQIDSYLKQGYNKKDAVSQLQNLYQTKIQADAITNAAYIMSSAYATGSIRK